MTAFCVHQFSSTLNILFQSLIIAPLHAIFFSFFFFETVENVRHRKKLPAAHSTNTCRVFSSFPVCFPSDRAPFDNFVSAWTRVGGMGECRGKSRKSPPIFFETFVTRFFPLGLFLFLFPFVSLTHSATMKILPVLLLRPSSGWEEARDDSARIHFLLLLLSSFFVILLRNFPRNKPRQQIFTDGPQGGRSNKCLIVLTILSVLHEFHRVLPLVKQRSFALYLSAFNFPPRSASLLFLVSYYFLVFFFSFIFGIR